MVGCCEYGNEASGSIKLEEFLDWVRNLLFSQEEFCSMGLVIRSVS